MHCGVAEICILEEVMNGGLWVSNLEVWKLAKNKDVEKFSLNVLKSVHGMLDSP